MIDKMKVSRVVIERIVRDGCVSVALHDQLRQALASHSAEPLGVDPVVERQPVESWPCWCCSEHVTMADRAEADGDCPHCEAELDLDDWPIREPSAELLQAQATIAQQAAEIERLKGGQGEPVTIEAVAVTRDNGDGSLRLEWLLEGGIAQMEFAGMTLFAIPEANELCDEDGSAEIYLSQPAPVSVVESAKCSCPSGDGSLAWPCKAHPVTTPTTYDGFDNGSD